MGNKRSVGEFCSNCRTARAWVAAGVLATVLSCGGASSTPVTPQESIQVFEMHPTAQLLVEEKQRRSLMEMPDDWFDRRSNAVYATLPKKSDLVVHHKNTEHHRHLEDFHGHRHLSRYEREYRIKNNLELDFDWDGVYRIDSVSNTSNTAFPHLRRKLPSTDPYQAVPLNQGYGTHYTHVWVGTPRPQRQSVIVDTGSHFTAFPCVTCRGCGEEHHTDKHFDFHKSMTFRSLSCRECHFGASCHSNQCMFSQSYTEGSSWDAFQAEDMFFAGGNDVLSSADPADQRYSIPFMFGCQTAETGLFLTQLADGIMGMSAHEYTLPKQLYNAGKISRNMFSLCFRRELTTSKRGVTAGFMSLGGVDSRIDSSPMVYAKNVATSGWFTVYVKNVFVRTNGGHSATSVPQGDQQIVKIPFDPIVINSGKGVIVDSGTTDTYLHKSLAKTFVQVWKQVTGRDYTHNGISLTRQQLESLPTLLVQCQAYDAKHAAAGGAGLVGRVGNLDPHSPNDVLIAIPATNYMEYSPSTDQYTSRLYFTETHGGVLGSNAMQGHNVAFDWGKGRIGFAESSCEYRSKDAPPDDIADLEAKEPTDCILGKPILSHSCVESVNLDLCSQDMNQVLEGVERWTMMVKQPQTGGGLSCEDAAARSASSRASDPTSVECDGSGVCTELRQCQVPCADEGVKKETAQLVSTTPSTSTQSCENTWSACDSSCIQSRVLSALSSDGICREQSRLKRSCHTAACLESNPCLVPFFVNAVVGLRGTPPAMWSKRAEELLSAALAKAAQRLSPNASKIFDVGDVEVTMSRPWLAEDRGGQVKVTGATDVQLALKISIVDVNAALEDTTSGKVDSQTDRPPHRLLQMWRSIKGIPVWRSGLERKASCGDNEELYTLARRAKQLQYILEGQQFLAILAEELRHAEGQNGSSASSPFRALYSSGDLISQSRVLSAWTTQANEDEDALPSPLETTFIVHAKRLRQYANRSPFMSVAAFSLILFFLLSACIGAYETYLMKDKCCDDDKSDERQSSIERLNEESDEEEIEFVKLLPSSARYADDDASARSRMDIDDLLEQLVTSGGSPTRNLNSPRRRNSLDMSWSMDSGDMELASVSDKSPVRKRI